MKVLHIVANPRIDPRTIEARADGLARYGAQVGLVDFGTGRPVTGLSLSGRAHHHLGGRVGGAALRRRRLQDLLDREAPDVIHVDDPQHPDGRMAIEVADGTGRALVAETRRELTLADAIQIPHRAQVIAPDASVVRVLAGAGFPGERRLVSPLASVPAPVAPALQTPHTMRHLTGIGDRLLLLHASGLRNDDDAAYLVRYAASLRARDPAFVLVTFAGPRARRHLRYHARGTGLLGQIIVPVDTEHRHDVHTLTGAADLVLATGARDRWVRALPAAIAALQGGAPVAVGWDDDFTRKIEVAGAGFALEDDPEWAAFETARLLRQPLWRAHARRAAERLSAGPNLGIDLDLDRACAELAASYHRLVDPTQPATTEREPAQAA